MIVFLLILIAGAMVAFAALELWLFWYLGDWDDWRRRRRMPRHQERGRLHRSIGAGLPRRAANVHSERSADPRCEAMRS
jgi:hypothetical protein